MDKKIVLAAAIGTLLYFAWRRRSGAPAPVTSVVSVPVVPTVTPVETEKKTVVPGSPMDRWLKEGIKP